MPRGPRGLYGLSIIPVIAAITIIRFVTSTLSIIPVITAITIIRFVTSQVASIWGAPKLGLGVMRRVPLYFLFGEPATTVGQSRPSREAPASGDAKKKLRRKARALATRGKPRAVQSRKGVVRTATKVIAPAGAARRSRKAASRATSASRTLSDEQHFAWHAPRARGAVLPEMRFLLSSQCVHGACPFAEWFVVAGGTKIALWQMGIGLPSVRRGVHCKGQH